MVPGDGKLELTFTPKNGGEPMKFNVFDFEGTGGVALAMYNTDKVSTYIGQVFKDKSWNVRKKTPSTLKL